MLGNKINKCIEVLTEGRGAQHCRHSSAGAVRGPGCHVGKKRCRRGERHTACKSPIIPGDSRL